MKLSTLAQLYEHFDSMVDQDASADELFASSYIRGFISLVASEFGDESQPLSLALMSRVTEKLKAARSELTPDDRQIVSQYWQQLIEMCSQ